eukprot:2441359-Pyramimonas_sp.AAC.1
MEGSREDFDPSCPSLLFALVNAFLPAKVSWGLLTRSVLRISGCEVYGIVLGESRAQAILSSRCCECCCMVRAGGYVRVRARACVAGLCARACFVPPACPGCLASGSTTPGT